MTRSCSRGVNSATELALPVPPGGRLLGEQEGSAGAFSSPPSQVVTVVPGAMVLALAASSRLPLHCWSWHCKPGACGCRSNPCGWLQPLGEAEQPGWGRWRGQQWLGGLQHCTVRPQHLLPERRAAPIPPARLSVPPSPATAILIMREPERQEACAREMFKAFFFQYPL